MHISLAFLHEAEEMLLDAVRAEWDGRARVRWGRRWGDGFFVNPQDPLYQCPAIWAVYGRSSYWRAERRGLHISM